MDSKHPRLPPDLVRAVHRETLGGMVEAQDAADAHSRKVSALLDSLQKFALAGNAGGAIAAMSLIGTAVARAPQPGAPGYPWPYFVALLLFIAGLVFGWWAMAAKLRRARAEESFWEKTAEEAAQEAPAPRWETLTRRAWHWPGTEVGGVVCATILLAAGTSFGLIMLASLARW